MTDHTSRTIAREWWRERVETDDAVDIKKLARQAAVELAESPEFCSSFLPDFIESTMYDMGQRMVAVRRAELRTHSVLSKQIEADAKRDADKWDRWLEYSPESGIHIPLTKMTREQVVSAAEYRRDSGNAELFEARWLDSIANQLKPGQHVGDALDSERITQLRQSVSIVDAK